MLVLILIYDQLLFRPLLAWVQRFKYEEIGTDEIEPPWFLVMLRKARLFHFLARCADFSARLSSRVLQRVPGLPPLPRGSQSAAKAIDGAWNTLLLAGAAVALVKVLTFIHAEVGWTEAGHVVLLGAATLLRVVVLIALAAVFWVPIGVWIGLRPRMARHVQPVIQFLAAFPANLFFPIVVVLIVHFSLNTEIWLSPLMILGTQWYILFNVIAGTLSLPTDYQLVAGNFGVTRWLWWHFPGFRHRRSDRLGRLVERQHRRRGGEMGRHHAHRHRHRRLYRAGDRGGRLPSHRVGDYGTEPVCIVVQPAAVAPALQSRRRALAARLMKDRLHAR